MNFEEEELMYNSEFMLILEQTRKEREAKQQGKKLERVLTASYASNMERDRFMYGEFERQSREITYLKVSLWALALLTALNFVLGVK